MRVKFIQNLNIKSLNRNVSFDNFSEQDFREFLELEITSRKSNILEFLGRLKEIIPEFKKKKKYLQSILEMTRRYYLTYYGIMLGQYEEAKKILEKSISILKDYPELKHMEVFLENNHAIYLIYSAKFDEARQILEKLIKDNHLKDFSQLYIMTMNRLGVVYRNLGEHQKAKKIFLNILKMSKRRHDLRRIAIIYNNISNLPDTVIPHIKSAKYKKEAYKIFKKIGERFGEAIYLDWLGSEFFNQNKFEKALENYHESYRINMAINNLKGEIISSFNLGAVLIDIGDFKGAQNTIHNLLQKFRNLDMEEKASFLLLNEFIKIGTDLKRFKPDNLLNIYNEAKAKKLFYLENESTQALLEFYYRKRDVGKMQQILAEIEIDSRGIFCYYLLYLSLLNKTEILSNRLKKLYNGLNLSNLDYFFHYCAYRYFMKINKKTASIHIRKSKASLGKAIRLIREKKNIRNIMNVWYVQEILNAKMK